MVKSQFNSNQKEEEKIQVNMETVKYYFTKEGGMVITYRVETSGLLNNFYLVSFDDGSSEMAWGLGATPETALKEAAREWDFESETEKERKENPFREVLEKQ